MDRRGRRRQPGQERGLRPLHPPLPQEWLSKAIRVAMPREDWERFEELAGRLAPQSVTRAKANGAVLSALLEAASPPRHAEPRPLDWMDWERQKTLRLLREAI